MGWLNGDTPASPVECNCCSRQDFTGKRLRGCEVLAEKRDEKRLRETSAAMVVRNAGHFEKLPSTPAAKTDFSFKVLPSSNPKNKSANLTQQQ